MAHSHSKFVYYFPLFSRVLKTLENEVKRTCYRKSQSMLFSLSARQSCRHSEWRVGPPARRLSLSRFAAVFTCVRGCAARITSHLPPGGGPRGRRVRVVGRPVCQPRVEAHGERHRTPRRRSRRLVTRGRRRWSLQEPTVSGGRGESVTRLVRGVVVADWRFVGYV